MTTQWLVVKGYESAGETISVYSLPDLQFRDQSWLSGRPSLRAGNDGVIYVPIRYGAISMVEISNTGKLSVQSRLAARGRLRDVATVAVGPQPGQLCAGNIEPLAVYIIDIKNDSIEQTLVLPSGIHDVRSVAALSSGQILVADRDGNLAWYRSVLEPAILLTDTPVTGREVIMLGNTNQLLVATWWGSQLYAMDSEGGWHTVDALKWETGVLLPAVIDVAVWENCV